MSMTNEELARHLIHFNPAFHEFSLGQIINYLENYREEIEEGWESTRD